MEKIREYVFRFALQIALVAEGYIVSMLYPDASIRVWLVVLVLALLVIWLSRPKGIKIRDDEIIVGAVLVIVIGIFVYGVLKLSPEKHISCLGNEELRRIDWAIEEKNTQHFEQEIRNLYPYLIKCGLKTPLIDPVRVGYPMYDNTWYGFHLTFLKVLRRQIRNDEFDAGQWNTDVDRENAKRRNVAEQHIGPGTKSEI